MEGTPQQLYDFYALRGDSENRTKELKNDLKADRLSCHRFVANQLRLLLHAAAYVLLTALKKYLKGTILEKAQIGTIRCQLIKIGAQVV
ncbi:MAG: transposase, partial [Candidatus Zixiibacteriota bacterium]